MRSVDDLPADYDERVYAGVLGKIIGVYLGRPFEGWTYDRILRDLGEITGYVNDRVDLPLNNHLLVVTDDQQVVVQRQVDSIIDVSRDLAEVPQDPVVGPPLERSSQVDADDLAEDPGVHPFVVVGGNMIHLTHRTS